MPVPMRQAARMGAYLMEQKLRRRDKFPLIVELEPLFQCNLACAGCGKIQHPEATLKKRMSVEQAIGAIEQFAGAREITVRLLHARPTVDGLEYVGGEPHRFLIELPRLLRPPLVFEIPGEIGIDDRIRRTDQLDHAAVVIFADLGPVRLGHDHAHQIV